MKHVLSTHLFVNHRLTGAQLGRIEQAGIPEVEIFCARQHLDYRDPGQLSELGHWFRDSKLRAFSLHSPMHTDEIWGRSGPQSHITITEPVKAKRQPMVDEIKRALDVADFIPFRYLVQHIGVSEEEFSMHKVDAAFTALEELRVFAKQRGVEILLENIPNDLSSAERLLQFETLTHIGLGCVFDTGHANLTGNLEGQFDLLKPRIRSTHVHDNDGELDAHLFPFTGSIAWCRLMPKLRACGDQFPLLLELKEKPEITNPVERVSDTFERLETVREEE